MHRPGPPHVPRGPLPSRRQRPRPTGHSPPSTARHPTPGPSPRLTCVSAAGREGPAGIPTPTPTPPLLLRVAASQTGSAYCEMVGEVSLGSQSEGGVANTASAAPLPRPAPAPVPAHPRGPRGAVPGLGSGVCKPRPLLPTGTPSGVDSGVHGTQERCSPGTLSRWVSQPPSLECSPTGWARAVCSAVDRASVASLWV